MVVYYFSPFVAKELNSVEAAVFLSNIEFWINTNKSNNSHFIDGKYWTYNTQKSFCQLYPYMNERQIKYLIDKLQKDGYLVVRQYNKAKMDRTNWYSLTDKYYTMVQNCTIEETKMYLGKYNIVPAIPYINPDIKHTDKEKDIDSVPSSISKEKKRFNGVNPAKEEVEAYIREKGFHVSADRIISYYTNAGDFNAWRFKDGSLVRDWKRCVCTCERNWKSDNGDKPDVSDEPPLTESERIARERSKRKMEEFRRTHGFV